MEPKFGDISNCSQCGKEIIFVGPYWDHMGDRKPRHTAQPGAMDTAEAEPKPHGAWYALLSPREQATIDHARAYAANFSHAGVPGHSAHLLIAKLAELLDRVSHDLDSNIPPMYQEASDGT